MTEDKTKTMAMHQANYIPWIGYFYKMIRCDMFVYLDDVQYPRGQSFAARNRIKTPNGPAFLTIPVSLPKGRKGKASYMEATFSDRKWKEKHLKTVTLSYKKAPYFDEIFAIYEQNLKQYERLLELNIALIESFADYLKISSERRRLSELLEQHGQKTDLIVDICGAVNADHYLSGTGGGKDYNDEQQLAANGITLIYSDFVHPQYTQLWGTFVSHLSILDLLFNEGPNSKAIIEQAGQYGEKSC